MKGETKTVERRGGKGVSSGAMHSIGTGSCSTSQDLCCAVICVSHSRANMLEHAFVRSFTHSFHGASLNAFAGLLSHPLNSFTVLPSLSLNNCTVLLSYSLNNLTVLPSSSFNIFYTAQCKCTTHKLSSRQKAARSLVWSGVKGCSTYGGNLTCLSVCSGVTAYSTYASTSRLPVCLCRCEGVLDSHRHVERGLYHGGAHSERPPAVRQKRNGADSQDLQPGGKPHG